MNLPRLSRTCLLLLAVLPAGAAVAGERGGQSSHERGRYIVLADSGMSLDQAVSMVEKRFNARVVRTEVRNEGDRKIYVLRLLNDAGRVWTVRVDASNGSVS